MSAGTITYPLANNGCPPPPRIPCALAGASDPTGFFVLNKGFNLGYKTNPRTITIKIIVMKTLINFLLVNAIEKNLLNNRTVVRFV
jgi:hypothetical protein